MAYFFESFPTSSSLHHTQNTKGNSLYIERVYTHLLKEKKSQSMVYQVNTLFLSLRYMGDMVQMNDNYQNLTLRCLSINVKLWCTSYVFNSQYLCTTSFQWQTLPLSFLLKLSYANDSSSYEAYYSTETLQDMK